MEDTVIRPTMKFIKLGYALVLLAIVAGVIGFSMISQESEWKNRPWIMAVPALLLIWPVRRHIARQFTKATIAGDRLRYEVGAMAKSTRNISLPKVQDARVDQSVMQRMFGIGDLSIETAGETSRLTIRNVDQPQQVADEILAASHAAPGSKGQIT
ncbi:MAG TPA: PH domain-containing protein [Bryobacteraceae bacterium]|nr:PH domain-containing protein [Bryobacteraceae bacterium]